MCGGIIRFQKIVVLIFFVPFHENVHDRVLHTHFLLPHFQLLLDFVQLHLPVITVGPAPAADATLLLPHLELTLHSIGVLPCL